MLQVRHDVVVVREELTRRLVDVVARGRDGQRDESRALVGQGVEHGFRVLGSVEVADHGADDPGGVVLAALDDGEEIGLRIEDVLHLAAMHTDADDTPVHADAPARQFVEVHGLVRPVESADPEMHDARSQFRRVVGGQLNRSVARAVLGPGDHIGQGQGFVQGRALGHDSLLVASTRGHC
nr:hypothetical protein [Arthrobacter sp. NamB2]